MMRLLPRKHMGRRNGNAVLMVLLLSLPGWAADEPASGVSSPANVLTESKSTVAGEPSLPLTTTTMMPRAFGNIPLSFIRNDGQADAAVRFEVRGRGYWLSLEQSHAVLAVASSTGLAAGQPAEWGGSDPFSWLSAITQDQAAIPFLVPSVGPFNDPTSEFREVRMKLIGAKPDAVITGEEELPGKFHYFIGNNPAGWRTNVPSFAKVRYRDIYPSIDLVFYGNQGQLEYDFVLAPKADPNQIQFAIEGADGVEVDVEGNLRLAVAGQELRWRKPTIYQECDGVRVLVAGEYVLQSVVPGSVGGKIHQVAFHIAPYDRMLALVIDPVLVYGTFLGASDGASSGTAIATDHNGCVYVAGRTAAPSFPTKNAVIPNKPGTGACFFLTKLDAAGQIIYSTYIGPIGQSYGSPRLTLDGAGSAYLVGSTSSPTFPVVNAMQPAFGGGTQEGDAFVSKVAPDGSALVYSTYLGGSGNDTATAVAVDSEGSAYVAGWTASLNFPVTHAIQSQYKGGENDAFVAKLNASGTALHYSTYFGGTDWEVANAIALDAQGNACIAGVTASGNLVTKEAFQSAHGGDLDGFWAKLSPNGDALLSASYFGGTATDYIYSMAVGSGGDIYLTGNTLSEDFPIANAIQPQKFAAGGPCSAAFTAFAARYAPASNSLVFSTYLGGSVTDVGVSLALDAVGNVYLGGETLSPDFPTTVSAIQGSNNGGDASCGVGYEGFLSVLSSDGSTLLYSSFLGGSNDDFIGINALALDHGGNVYVTGSTASEDFPIAQPLLPYPGTNSVFVVKFSPIVPGPPLLQISHAAGSVHISWPVVATNFVLEATTSLPTVSWTTVTNTPSVTPTERSVQLPLTGNARFFRLRQP